MSSMENEQGWTLSKSEATKTKGKRKVPWLLIFHISEVAAVLCRNNTSPVKTAATIMKIIISLFIFME